MSRRIRSVAWAVSLASLAFLAGSAGAQEAISSPVRVLKVQSVTGASPECACRARGQSFAVGTEICLSTPDGLQRLLCAMDQNVTSWKRQKDPCALS